MAALLVTPLYAGILVLWFVVLSARVANIRRRGISFGDNGDPAITPVVRAQANFAEYVPIALLMMAFLEANRFSIYWLHALGVALVVARLLHGLALSFNWQRRAGRVAGATLTFIILVVGAVQCIYVGIKGQWLWLQ